MKYKSVFIELESQDWILNILGRDLYNGLEKQGYKCNIGKYEEYSGEDISFHMWWGLTQPHKEAKVNAIFITHTDDQFKENRLLKIKNEYDFYFCMSPEDAQYLLELGYDKSKVYGLNLPVRNTYVRPITMGIFSRCYPDKRKNEDWLLRYCENHPISKLVDFVFIGKDWGDFVGRLSKLGCSFQWHNVSRNMPYEYMYQQLKMTNLDYYIYMGMDGGAMGAYDAYAMGTSLCISDDGYHKGIPDVDYLFLNEEEFVRQMDIIIEKQHRKIYFFFQNTAENYARNVSFILENRAYPTSYSIPTIEYSVKEKRRSNFFKRSKLKELHEMAFITLQNIINRRKLRKINK
jgi:hypothetical protein